MPHAFRISRTAEAELSTEGTEECGGSQNPHFYQPQGEVGHPESSTPGLEYPEVEDDFASWEERRIRRIYRGRTVAMLRRYMRYSIETGRLPSLLGREFFRSKVTSYTVVTFEDRVIFVHDMETCLGKLDEFSRELIARHVLQEHDQPATARLLGCSERTVRSYVPLAIDLLAEILLEVGLLECLTQDISKPCQGGKPDLVSVSNC